MTRQFGVSNSEWTALLSKQNHSYYIAPTLDFISVDIKYAALSFILHGMPAVNILGTRLKNQWNKKCVVMLMDTCLIGRNKRPKAWNDFALNERWYSPKSVDK